MKLRAKIVVVDIFSKVGVSDLPAQVAVRLYTRKEDEPWEETGNYPDPVMGRQPMLMTVGMDCEMSWEINLE